jgi:tRNA (cytidine(34)-2'-O)-methyltransferase
VHIVLVEPEIAPNTGSIARLCAATTSSLHLVEPLGFTIDDKHLRRAGLDYWPYVDVHRYPTWDAFRSTLPAARLFFFRREQHHPTPRAGSRRTTSSSSGARVTGCRRPYVTHTPTASTASRWQPHMFAA